MATEKEAPQAEDLRTASHEADEKEGNGKSYSKGLKDVTIFTEEIGDASSEIADAVSKGLKRFRKLSEESAKKKKDGALLDIIPNMGKGLTTTIDAAKDVPTQIGDAFDTKTTRRVIKRVSRSLSSIFRVLD